MSDQIVDFLEQLTLVELKTLDIACSTLRESIASESPRSPESFVEDVSEPQRSCMLLELIGSEIEARLDADQNPSLADYLVRYPQFTKQLPAIFTERSHDHSRSKSSASKAHRTSFDAEQMVGSQLGHYTIQSVIGRGGMGFVLAARDTKLDREVAIKLASSKPLKDDKLVASFKREARIAAAVRHENIVTIHSVEEQDGRPFLVMERIEGYTLEQYVRTHGPMNANEVIEVGLQIANGLAAAHSVGLTHHDIKPSNILLESMRRAVADDAMHPFRVKLTDFGLAQSVSSPSRAPMNYLIGTPMYMSPEQAGGSSMDARSDLFSLGSVLYYLCSGTPPFASGKLESVLTEVRSCQPKSLQSINSSIPEGLANVIRRLMARSPSDRPASADEVIHQLQSIRSTIATKLAESTKSQPRNLSTLSPGLTMSMLIVVCGMIWLGSNRGRIKQDVDKQNASQSSTDSRFSQPNSISIWSMPTKVAFVDGDSSGSNPTITGDGLRLIFLRRFLTGAEFVEAKRNSTDEPFDTPQVIRLLPPNDDAVSEQIGIGTPSISADGLTLTFYRMTMPGHQADLWSSRRDSLDSPWQPMTKLEDVNTPNHEYAPCVSRDGLDLYWFHVSPDCIDNADIWTATRGAADMPFTNLHKLSDEVNSATNEQHPHMTASGEMLYFDRGTPEPRLWQAPRSVRTGEFASAVRVALPEDWNDINAYAPTLTSDGRLLIFTSNTIPGKQGFETGVLWQSCAE